MRLDAAAHAPARSRVGYEWGPSILWAPSWIADLHVMLSGCDVGKFIGKPAGAPAAR